MRLHQIGEIHVKLSHTDAAYVGVGDPDPWFADPRVTGSARVTGFALARVNIGSPIVELGYPDPGDPVRFTGAASAAQFAHVAEFGVVTGAAYFGAGYSDPRDSDPCDAGHSANTRFAFLSTRLGFEI